MEICVYIYMYRVYVYIYIYIYIIVMYMYLYIYIYIVMYSMSPHSKKTSLELERSGCSKDRCISHWNSPRMGIPPRGPPPGSGPRIEGPKVEKNGGVSWWFHGELWCFQWDLYGIYRDL